MRLFGMTVYFKYSKLQSVCGLVTVWRSKFGEKKTIQIEFCAKFIAKIGDRKKFTCLLQNFIYSSIKE